GQLGPIAAGIAAVAALELAAMDRDEAGAEALEAGVVLVAGALVDGALAAERSFDRHHRKAVRLHAAVAAALAHPLVDEYPSLGHWCLAALAAPAQLGGADLIVDQHRGAGDFPQLALHAFEAIAVVDAEAAMALGQGPGVFLRIIADQGDALDAFALQLLDQLFHREAAIDVLAAGHGHGVVVEDLVGDVHLGGDGRADGENAGVEVGAVADVLEHVRSFGKGRLTDPGRALAAHLGEGVGVAVHPGDHVM